ncbi:MAG: peptide chain release factor N(5)-glutamine methyltransferase [Bdellovibrionales bacterium]|jgi:release factor glutamine methyltransferase|nr:peptide chain release factor N(5)-glutamine methyltransferase [Bdellovibrionales bacterium]
MDSYASLAKKFYEKEKDFLLKNYPGLTLHRLKRELEEYSHGFLDQNEFLKSPFLEGETSASKSFLEKVKKAIPLEYIQGHCYFYNSRYFVTPDVLIPRNETETLVEMAILWLQKRAHKAKLNVLDCCTGSGVVAISILSECDFPLNVVGTDIDNKALDVAKRNLYLHQFSIHPESSCQFKQMDRLEGALEQQDLIVANPPYIKAKGDIDGVHSQTLKYEPKMALFIEDNEYESWYQTFFDQALKKLNHQGSFLMEGHENHLKDLKSLALKCGFKEAHILNDLTGAQRFLSLTKE